MVEESKPESVGVRFGIYIEELREFFTSRGVAFGTPADVVLFAERVSEAGPFQEEMGSLVRSIMYRESEKLGRGELLELVAVAVGGPEIQAAAQEMHGAVRQLFVFVNGALRQQRNDAPSQLPATPLPEMREASRPEGRFTAGEMLPATPQDPAPPLVEAKAPPAMPRSAPMGNEVLYRAVSMAAEESSQRAEATFEPEPQRRWLVPAIAAGLVLLAGALLFARPVFSHRAQPATAVADTSAAQPRAGAALSSCIAPMLAGVSRSGLEERARWAHNLLNQKLYEAALPEIREIARLDPGYPGIHLDESDALLQLKRTDDAREAVDTQIVIGECLAKLPSPALDSYCSAQYGDANVGRCRPELAHLRQAAQLQAALVHLELGHQVQPDSDTSAAIAELKRDETTPGKPPAKTHAATAPKRRPVAALPPATEGDAESPTLPRAVTPIQLGGKRKPADDPLVHSEGTDSSLGAYSKPD